MKMKTENNKELEICKHCGWVLPYNKNKAKLLQHINNRLEDWRFILKTAYQVDKKDYISEAIAIIQELTIIKELMEDNENV